ncbi:MAG: hypothetical protein AB7F22_30200 [Reyranella sp.]|uniref:hypothetical protein n=1 Tax=Reyranella sp. TaxID=1929291 RepID=UPI003D137D98
MNPGSSVIAKFGGVRPLARLLDINPTNVSRWQLPKPRGTGGLIPSKYHKPLLTLAKRRKVRLTVEELVY